jgi:hypothetical protein
MSWRTEISLKNNTNDDQLFVIPKGQVFENKKINTGLQNVAAAREYRLIIPANSRLVVEVQVYCVNEKLSSPHGFIGNITVFKIDKPFKTQDELWGIMSIPSV